MFMDLMRDDDSGWSILSDIVLRFHVYLLCLDTT